ncbi:right-handed parallel beta-helix repeat-containing protein [Methylobacterium sp. ID0610]|uniref:right-handed parallel beta-helix repeat-containing protein n=1 Tax=Methylobacterium carpenticola TaxID=3344827 RepID=UPI0036AEC896
MRFTSRHDTVAHTGSWWQMKRRSPSSTDTDQAGSDSSLPAASDPTDPTAATPDPVTTAPTTPSDTTEPTTGTPSPTTPVATAPEPVVTPPVSDPVTTAPVDDSTDPVASTPAVPPTTAPAAGAPTTTTPTTLTRHDGTVVAKSGDVIKDLDIYVSDGEGITLDDADNVTISNVRIHYNGAGTSGEGSGISALNADGLKIDHVEIFDAGAPASGAERSTEHNGIALYQSPGAQVSAVTIHDASTGIYLQDSPNAILTGIEGYDMRGPYPRGQLVQFNRSGNSSLENFYVHNDAATSWVEDNINVGDSNNVTIKNGLIDGNNSPSGQGVIFENSTGGLVQNVDVMHMGNGGFADYGSGNTFDHVRSFDNFATDQGRGQPMSNGLIFGLANDTTVTNASYQNPGAPQNIVYGEAWENGTFGGTFSATEVTGQTPMAAWHNTFNWA